MQIDRTTVRKRYAIHRFNFTIQKPESCITGIDVLWDGKGYKRFGCKGAAIYVWNFTDSCYEKLSSGTSIYLTLEANITENIENYIADDGTFIIIAQQNSRQTWILPYFLKWIPFFGLLGQPAIWDNASDHLLTAPRYSRYSSPDSKLSSKAPLMLGRPPHLLFDFVSSMIITSIFWPLYCE